MSPDESKIIQTFTCKDCGEEIPYIREVVQGLLITDDEQARDEPTVVYLECSNGHTHPYKVTGG